MTPLKFKDQPNDLEAVEMLTKFDHGANSILVNAGTLYFLLNHYFSAPKKMPQATPNDHNVFKEGNPKVIRGLGVSQRNRDFLTALTWLAGAKDKNVPENPQHMQKLKELADLFLKE